MLNLTEHEISTANTIKYLENNVLSFFELPNAIPCDFWLGFWDIAGVNGSFSWNLNASKNEKLNRFLNQICPFLEEKIYLENK